MWEHRTKFGRHCDCLIAPHPICVLRTMHEQHFRKETNAFVEKEHARKKVCRFQKNKRLRQVTSGKNRAWWYQNIHKYYLCESITIIPCSCYEYQLYWLPIDCHWLSMCVYRQICSPSRAHEVCKPSQAKPSWAAPDIRDKEINAY